MSASQTGSLPQAESATVSIILYDRRKSPSDYAFAWDYSTKFAGPPLALGIVQLKLQSIFDASAKEYQDTMMLSVGGSETQEWPVAWFDGLQRIMGLLNVLTKTILNQHVRDGEKAMISTGYSLCFRPEREENSGGTPEDGCPIRFKKLINDQVEIEITVPTKNSTIGNSLGQLTKLTVPMDTRTVDQIGYRFQLWMEAREKAERIRGQRVEWETAQALLHSPTP